MADAEVKAKRETDNFPNDPKKLSGYQKAAILLISLGVEEAAKILKQLQDSEVEKITMIIAEMQNIESEMVEVVRNEYYKLMETNDFMLEGGTGYARDLLTESLGKEKANEVMKKHDYEKRVDAFKLFQSAEMAHVIHFLKRNNRRLRR